VSLHWFCWIGVDTRWATEYNTCQAGKIMESKAFIALQWDIMARLMVVWVESIENWSCGDHSLILMVGAPVIMHCGRIRSNRSSERRAKQISRQIMSQWPDWRWFESNRFKIGVVVTIHWCRWIGAPVAMHWTTIHVKLRISRKSNSFLQYSLLQWLDWNWFESNRLKIGVVVTIHWSRWIGAPVMMRWTTYTTCEVENITEIKLFFATQFTSMARLKLVWVESIESWGWGDHSLVSMDWRTCRYASSYDTCQW
jgi:hypothetical protein